MGCQQGGGEGEKEKYHLHTGEGGVSWRGSQNDSHTGSSNISGGIVRMATHIAELLKLVLWPVGCVSWKGVFTYTLPGTG